MLFLLLVFLLVVVVVAVVVVAAAAAVGAVLATQLIVAFLWTPKNRQIGGVFAYC